MALFVSFKRPFMYISIAHVIGVAFRKSGVVSLVESLINVFFFGFFDLTVTQHWFCPEVLIC